MRIQSAILGVIFANVALPSLAQMRPDNVVCTIVPERGQVCMDNGARGNDGLGGGRPGYNPGRPGYDPGRPGPIRPIPPGGDRPPYIPGPGYPNPYPQPFPGPVRPLPPPPPYPYPNPYPVPPPPPIYPAPQPGYPVYGDRIEVPIYRTLNNENLYLNNYLSSGATLYSVEVSHSGYQDSAWLNLNVDGVNHDSEYAGYDSYSILTPRSPISLYQGAYGRSVQLQVSGSVYIERIVLVVDRSGGYNPPPNYGTDLQASVLGNYQGANSIELFYRMNLSSYYGYRIESVTVYGSSARGFGQVSVMTNGYNRGSMTMPTQMSQQVVYLSGMTIGRDVSSLDLNLQGNLWIERVVVRVSR